MNRNKPVIPCAIAQDEADEAVEHYLNEHVPEAALGFMDALARAYTQISRSPATGAPRYAHELNSPGRRCRALKNYPYLAFYVAHENHIDVWRIAQGSRAIPPWMQGESAWPVLR